MASTKREGVKSAVLLLFVAAGVALIGLIWVDGLVGDQPATPAYYRDAFQIDPNVYGTLTAEATAFRTQAPGTATPGPGTGADGSPDAPVEKKATAVPGPARVVTPTP
jgi:hypothetical protein